MFVSSRIKIFVYRGQLLLCVMTELVAYPRVSSYSLCADRKCVRESEVAVPSGRAKEKKVNGKYTFFPPKDLTLNYLIMESLISIEL